MKSALELKSSLLSLCREPRGIGFLEYTDPRDAEDAILGLDRKVIQGKEVRHAPVPHRSVEPAATLSVFIEYGLASRYQ